LLARTSVLVVGGSYSRFVDDGQGVVVDGDGLALGQNCAIQTVGVQRGNGCAIGDACRQDLAAEHVVLEHKGQLRVGQGGCTCESRIGGRKQREGTCTAQGVFQPKPDSWPLASAGKTL